jgi:hypothetical protein
VVGNNDQRPSLGKGLVIFKSIAGSQQVTATHQQQIEVTDTFLMCGIPKPIKTDPLNWMKDKQGHSKEEEINTGKRIRQYFSHVTKIKNRTVLVLFSALIFFSVNRIHRKLP